MAGAMHLRCCTVGSSQAKRTGTRRPALSMSGIVQQLAGAGLVVVPHQRDLLAVFKFARDHFRWLSLSLGLPRDKKRGIFTFTQELAFRLSVVCR